MTYENILKRVRRVYHKLVAEWLIERGGERMSEFTGLIAEHLELAGETEQAIAYLAAPGSRRRPSSPTPRRWTISAGR